MRERPPFLQDFCKKAQWRAKKLRERGSNTARPTEKGRGGLPIGSRLGRFGRFRRVASCRFGRFRRDLKTSSWCFVPIRSVSSCRFGRDSVDWVDFVAICRLPLGVSCRFGRFRRVASCRFGRFRRVASCRFGRFRRDLKTSSWCFVPIRSVSSCRVAAEDKAQTQKKPDSSMGESGAAIATRRALLTFG